ncbi:MAG: hypothetical protein IT304_06875 [Dehalococcoidia bacterium]|nr:hypothetical protein [Dehalococcoidia bacterium]
MYAFTQEIPLTVAFYRRLRTELGPEPPPGLIAHIVTEEERGVRYFEIWESREACDRFVADRVYPALARLAEGSAAGQRRPEPERREVTVAEVWTAHALVTSEL